MAFECLLLVLKTRPLLWCSEAALVWHVLWMFVGKQNAVC